MRISVKNFDRLTEKVVDYVIGELPRIACFDDIFLTLDLTYDQTLIICQIGEEFLRVNGKKALNRTDYDKDIGHFEISVFTDKIPDNIKKPDDTIEIKLVPEVSQVEEDDLRVID
jgi:hypothetical protein